jgi:undecaprenyl-diphosphatase
MSADTALLRSLRTRGHQPPVERAVRVYSKLGEHGALWLGIAAAGAALDEDRRAAWLRAGATVAASFVANQAVKLAVRRPRPALPDLPPLIETMSNRSYPSAHATTCGAATVAFRGLLPAAPLHAVAAAMALTRPYLGVHYPSDTLAGYALGVAVGELAAP